MNRIVLLALCEVKAAQLNNWYSIRLKLIRRNTCTKCIYIFFQEKWNISFSVKIKETNNNDRHRSCGDIEKTFKWESENWVVFYCGKKNHVHYQIIYTFYIYQSGNIQFSWYRPIRMFFTFECSFKHLILFTFRTDCSLIFSLNSNHIHFNDG